MNAITNNGGPAFPATNWSKDGDFLGGQAYYRAKWEEMEPTGGMAVFVLDRSGVTE
jgi:hypothetical protein